ncbi:putative phytosulfokines 6 [Spatholobus suberectus]|nr:putative phytosulfokines 6 [Spatholobus suberectus]
MLDTFSCFDPSLVVSHSLNEPMKQQIVLLFFVLLLSSFLVSARLLEPPKGPRQDEKEVEVNDDAIPHSFAELKDDMEELMGSEECYMKDEECISRRMMVEAHLDYIYTQHHKP